MQRYQTQVIPQRRNDNLPHQRRVYPNQRQALRDINGNIVVVGMETAAPLPALNHQPSQPPSPNQGRRKNCSRNRNRNRSRKNSRNGQTGQIIKLDNSPSPIQVHAHPIQGHSHGHPMMPAHPTMLARPMQAHPHLQRMPVQADPRLAIHRQHQTVSPVASTDDYSWSAPIKYVHMNGELTAVDNSGDVVMGEAPELETEYSSGLTAEQQMLILALGNEIGQLQISN